MFIELLLAAINSTLSFSFFFLLLLNRSNYFVKGCSFHARWHKTNNFFVPNEIQRCASNFSHVSRFQENCCIWNPFVKHHFFLGLFTYQHLIIISTNCVLYDAQTSHKSVFCRIIFYFIFFLIFITNFEYLVVVFFKIIFTSFIKF